MAPGWIQEKRRYGRYQTRTDALPDSYRAAVRALERYMLCFGPGTGDGVVSMLEDLADMFEQSAANGAPVRAVVGEDPVEFADTFIRNYPAGQWIAHERQRLTDAIEQVAGRDM